MPRRSSRRRSSRRRSSRRRGRYRANATLTAGVVNGLLTRAAEVLTQETTKPVTFQKLEDSEGDYHVKRWILDHLRQILQCGANDVALKVHAINYIITLANLRAPNPPPPGIPVQYATVCPRLDELKKEVAAILSDMPSS